MSETRFVGSIEITISISILPLATRKGGTNRSKERKGNREGDNDGVRRVRASTTSHVNIWLCVRYGGVRPVCMETKALPSWTTGVEPLVERPCLPTPRWTTRRNTLPFLSLSPSFFILHSCSLLARASARPRDSPILTLPRHFVLSFAADVEITPKYHRRIIAAAVLSIPAGSVVQV